MISTKQTFHEKLSNIAFLILFFGFFLYQFLLGINFIGAFLGGMHTLASTIFFIPALIWSLQSLFNKNDGRNLFILFILLILYQLIFSGINIIYSGYSFTEKPFIDTLTTAIIYIVTFYITVNMNFQDRNYNFPAILLFLSLLIVILYQISEGSFFAFFFLFATEGSESLATYQSIGRSFMVMAIFSLIFLKSEKSWAPVLITSIILLILCGARVQTLLMITFIFMYIFSNSRRLFFGLSFLLILLPIIFLIINNQNPEIIENLGKTRINEIFDLANSKSFIERVYSINYGLDVIRENPILGDYGQYHYYDGGYPHNILFMWTNYGIFGFLFFITLVSINAFSILGIKKREIQNENLLSVSKFFALIVIVNAIFLQAPQLSPIPIIGLGLTYRSLIERESKILK